jgi:acetolactate synthase I/II/III large subunit
MKISVSELIVQYLERLGVEVIFGMPGAHVLPIYDQLRDSRVNSVLVKHEQGAAFMAGGYARVSHQVSACIATAGPGATNLVTGIANAYAERLPILIITGETSTYIFGKGGLQESSGEGGAIDQGVLFSSITRYHKLIERTDYLGQVLNQATRALFAREPGPVLLSIPYNVQKELVDADVLDHLLLDWPQSVQMAPPIAPEPLPGAELAQLAELVRAAHYPVIIAGYGCIKAGAREVLANLSQALHIPVASSLKAKGVVSEGGALSLGCLGVTSNGQAYRYIVEHADLVIFLGAGFNERTSYLWDKKLLAGKKVAQVDRDAGQLGKVFKPDVAIHGDIRAVLTALLATLENEGAERNRLDRLDDHRHSENQPLAEAAAAQRAKFRLMEAFFAGLARRFPHDALIFDDNIVFAQSFFDVSDANHYFPNSGISSLGHAIPAAIGARFFAKGATFAILGDGGFQMCCMEIMTAVNYRIPLNVVVINNATMGLIRKNQFQLYGERYIDCDFVNPDFKLLAQSFGIRHHRIETETDLDRLFADADLTGAINLIEILLDKNAFPSYLSAR